MPALATTGTISIVSSVPGAQIELDGIKYKKDIYTGAVTTGTHIVRAFYPDEDIPFFETTATVKENESTSILIKNESSVMEPKPVEPKELKQAGASNSSDFTIGLMVDAKLASYLSSVAGLSSTSTADPMFGLGIVIKKPLGNDLSLHFQALYNTNSGFANALGTKTTIKVYPIELNLQKNYQKWFVGIGINYSLWNMSAGATSYNMQNGFGLQFYGGLPNFISNNTDLEIKYTYMSASTAVSGYTINAALGTLSVGTKIWLD